MGVLRLHRLKQVLRMALADSRGQSEDWLLHSEGGRYKSRCRNTQCKPEDQYSLKPM